MNGAASESGAVGPTEDTEPTLPVAVVARRLGVAPATLRTWDRRYGLGPSGHTDGKHRRYAPVDVARLEVMQRALLSGASTAEAARYALDAVDTSSDAVGAVPRRAVAEHTPLVPAIQDGVRLSRIARALSAAALAMDVRSIRQTIDDAIASEGAVAAWTDVVEPVLDAVSTRWRADRPGPEVGHLLAELASAALTRAAGVHRPGSHHPVLVAGLPAARSGLRATAFVAGLAESDVDAVAVAAPQASDALVRMLRGPSPSAVVLLAGDSAAPEVFRRLTRGRLRSRLFALGSAWEPATLPATVELLGDWPSAVRRVGYVVHGQ